MVVLRRLDCVTVQNKTEVLNEYQNFKIPNWPQETVEAALLNKFSCKVLNLSPYTFEKLIADSEGLASNLQTYIQGFTQSARDIFDKFNFAQEITKLNETDRLFQIVQEFAALDLHPSRISNIDMGYVFEELVRKFNEQANEEAGDHFTPREVIRLMTHLIYTHDEDIYKSGIVRRIYDPTCGTGGMLSVSEEYIRDHNKNAYLALFGQEYNPEAYAICCADLLIKGEEPGNIIFGDTLTKDGLPNEKFHYMLANPPFGVEWKTQYAAVEQEHEDKGFVGRFGPGLPRVSDGALLFLVHMLSKRHPSPAEGGEGSKIAIVFNGSPLFTGDAGSGESNIRRWIIENDWLDAIIALPDQMFYNTGISTYIWLLSNRKPLVRQNKIQLIDATRLFQKMRKSLGNKRNELSDAHIDEITRLYGDFQHNAKTKICVDGKTEERICSKIFANHEFGYLKITVERPLRLNFQASAERIERLKENSAFINLAESKKRKKISMIQDEIANGKKTQQQILVALQKLDPEYLYLSRAQFAEDLDNTLENKDIKLSTPLKKVIFEALGEPDENAAICMDNQGHPEPDPELRDTELVPLPKDISLPLPLGYEDKADNTELLKLVRSHCEDYLQREVLPHIPEAWIEHSKTKVGYEIPLNRHFYVYQPPRPLAEIEADIKKLEADIVSMLQEII